MVRILTLPALTASTSLQSAVCFDEHLGHMLFSKNYQEHLSLHPHPLLSSSSGLSTQQPEGRIDTSRHPHSVPEDGIIVVVMQHSRSSDGSRHIFDVTVRRRTLLEFSNAQAQVGAVETATGTGVGTVLVVPWEKWGPSKAHILEHDSLVCYDGSLAGERRATVRERRITIRDYNPFRVERALKLCGVEKEVTLECGSVVEVVKEKVVYRGGECFCDSIETNLPYVKTVVLCNWHRWCDEILMDKDNLVVVRTAHAGEVEFYLHSV